MSEKIWRGNVLGLAYGVVIRESQEGLPVMPHIGSLFQQMQQNPAAINHPWAWLLSYGASILAGRVPS
jgi:hypothetical protein